MDTPTPKNEPVMWAGALAMLVSLVAPWLAKRGLQLDETSVTAVLTPVVAWIFWKARSAVHPAHKVEEKVAAARAEGIAIGQAGPQ